MTPRAIVRVQAGGLDGGNTLRKSGPRGGIAAAHDKGHAKTMGADAFWIVGKHLLDLERGITPLREHQLESGFAPRHRVFARLPRRRTYYLKIHCGPHGPLLVPPRTAGCSGSPGKDSPGHN